MIFLLSADATALGAGYRHFSEEGNAAQFGLLDRFSSRECYYETRTASLMIYRSICSFNLAALSRTWSPTSVRNLSTSWQTIGIELELKSLSLSHSPLYVLATTAFRGLVSRISPILRQNRAGKTNCSTRNRRSSKTNHLLYQNVSLSTTRSELIDRAKFHYGIIALSKFPSRPPVVTR